VARGEACTVARRRQAFRIVEQLLGPRGIAIHPPCLTDRPRSPRATPSVHWEGNIRADLHGRAATCPHAAPRLRCAPHRRRALRAAYARRPRRVGTRTHRQPFHSCELEFATREVPSGITRVDALQALTSRQFLRCTHAHLPCTMRSTLAVAHRAPLYRGARVAMACTLLKVKSDQRRFASNRASPS
jgi:hypothetical protein